jgi:hypothetical protein
MLLIWAVFVCCFAGEDRLCPVSLAFFPSFVFFPQAKWRSL